LTQTDVAAGVGRLAPALRNPIPMRARRRSQPGCAKKKGPRLMGMRSEAVNGRLCVPHRPHDAALNIWPSHGDHALHHRGAKGLA
jgi:hypothetical protein